MPESSFSPTASGDALHTVWTCGWDVDGSLWMLALTDSGTLAVQPLWPEGVEDATPADRGDLCACLLHPSGDAPAVIDAAWVDESTTGVASLEDTLASMSPAWRAVLVATLTERWQSAIHDLSGEVVGEEGAHALRVIAHGARVLASLRRLAHEDVAVERGHTGALAQYEAALDRDLLPFAEADFAWRAVDAAGKIVDVLVSGADGRRAVTQEPTVLERVAVVEIHHERYGHLTLHPPRELDDLRMAPWQIGPANSLLHHDLMADPDPDGYIEAWRLGAALPYGLARMIHAIQAVRLMAATDDLAGLCADHGESDISPLPTAAVRTRGIASLADDFEDLGWVLGHRLGGETVLAPPGDEPVALLLADGSPIDLAAPVMHIAGYARRVLYAEQEVSAPVELIGYLLGAAPLLAVCASFSLPTQSAMENLAWQSGSGPIRIANLAIEAAMLCSMAHDPGHDPGAILRRVEDELYRATQTAELHAHAPRRWLASAALRSLGWLATTYRAQSGGWEIGEQLDAGPRSSMAWVPHLERIAGAALAIAVAFSDEASLTASLRTNIRRAPEDST